MFGQANGAAHEAELRRRLGEVSTALAAPRDPDERIGCIAVAAPTFLEPGEWVNPPVDWSSNIVSGKGYDLSTGEGARVYRDCLERVAARADAQEWQLEALERYRAGRPQLVVPRLGQGSFRLTVLDAYGHQCAVTSEHSLPVLDAAHIRPWVWEGVHDVRNGVPLRKDLHRLFDLGYVTISPDHRFAVSARLAEEWHNGRAYYGLDGRRIILPRNAAHRPDPHLLEWHAAEVFRD